MLSNGLAQLRLKAKTIDSGQFAEEGIRNHLRVFSGPGAGKTHWLSRQITGLVKARVFSARCQRLACISYTNVAVDSLQRRLGNAGRLCEVTTMHGFLYKNIVKPYGDSIESKDGRPLLNLKEIDGHDVPRPSYQDLKRWLGKIKKNIFLSPEHRSNSLKSLAGLRCSISSNGIELESPKSNLVNLTTVEFLEYKKHNWKSGVLEHEDVLYFAWRIAQEQKTLLKFISSRFPHILVDEFQDTNPIQTDLLRKLAEAGSKITVVGDLEQSIYAFQGARREDFSNFRLEGQVDLQLVGNRRSAPVIVSLLNELRTDGLSQVPTDPKRTGSIEVVVGALGKTIKHAKNKLTDGKLLQVLTRNNLQAAQIRAEAEDSSSGKRVWEEFAQVDSFRALFFERLCSAAILLTGKKPELAIEHIHKVFGNRRLMLKEPLQGSITELQRDKLEAWLLFETRKFSPDAELIQIYEALSEHFKNFNIKLKKLTKGKKPYRFLASHKWNSLLCSLKLGDDDRLVRTIHSAKGDEFDCIFVHFPPSKNSVGVVEHILGRKPKKPEEKRVTYVGLSRAKSQIFIHTNELDNDSENTLRNSNIKVTRLS